MHTYFIVQLYLWVKSQQEKCSKSQNIKSRGHKDRGSIFRSCRCRSGIGVFESDADLESCTYSTCTTVGSCTAILTIHWTIEWNLKMVHFVCAEQITVFDQNIKLQRILRKMKNRIFQLHLSIVVHRWCYSGEMKRITYSEGVQFILTECQPVFLYVLTGDCGCEAVLTAHCTHTEREHVVTDSFEGWKCFAMTSTTLLGVRIAVGLQPNLHIQRHCTHRLGKHSIQNNCKICRMQTEVLHL